MLSILKFKVLIFLFLILFTLPSLVFSKNDSSDQSIINYKNISDSLNIYILSIERRIETLETQNKLLITSMEVQISEAERKSRFLEITLAVLGGLLGVIIAVSSFYSIWQNKWERKTQTEREKWGREIQEKRETRENNIADTLQRNVQTVTNLMEIISKGQELAAFVKDTLERQREQTKSFKNEISAINSQCEKLLKEGLLKRRMVKQREIQGEISVIGNRIEKISMLIPLVPFELGEAELSSIAIYLQALNYFINNNYLESKRLFTEARHIGTSGDLLWQIPYYEGLIAKNEGNYETAISFFEEAILTRRETDPELGSRTEIAEITYFKWSRQKSEIEKQKGMIETRNRCLGIIKRAEGLEESSNISLSQIETGKNPNMTDEFCRLQSQCFLIAGNSFWIEKDFKNALLMYKKSYKGKKASIYTYSSIAQTLDMLKLTDNNNQEIWDYYEKSFNLLQSRLGFYDEAQNRVLRVSVFASCVKRLREANRIESTWEPIQYRITAERIIRDELKFKNPNIKLFSPWSKLHMDQDEFIEELHREIV